MSLELVITLYVKLKFINLHLVYQNELMITIMKIHQNNKILVIATLTG